MPAQTFYKRIHDSNQIGRYQSNANKNSNLRDPQFKTYQRSRVTGIPHAVLAEKAKRKQCFRITIAVLN